MRIRKLATGAIVGATLLGGALTPEAASAQVQSYQYSFQEHHASDSFTDSGICDPGPATIDLLDYNEAFHVSATQAGLTKDQVEALLESDGSGIITKLTYTQTGSFSLSEASGANYTGRFTSWFGGTVSNHTMVFGGTFSFNATGADGSHVSGHFNSHVTFVNGQPVVSFDKGTVTGCPTS